MRSIKLVYMNKRMSYRLLRWALFFTALLVGLTVVGLAEEPSRLSVPKRVGGKFQFTLVGQSNAAYVIESSADLQNWSPLSTNVVVPGWQSWPPSGTNTGFAAVSRISVEATEPVRFYRAWRLLRPLFQYALAVQDSIDVYGNRFFADSFDSSSPLFSTNGLYDPGKTLDHGDVAAWGGLAGLTNWINVGTNNWTNIGKVTIQGSLQTGPYGAALLGPQDTVGSAVWIQAQQLGIEPGHWGSNFVFAFPPVTLPLTFTNGSLTPASGWVTNYLYQTNSFVCYPVDAPVPVFTNTTKTSFLPLGTCGPIITNGAASKRTYTYPTYWYVTTSNVPNLVYYDYILDQNANYQLPALNGSIYVRAKATVYVTSSLNVTRLTTEKDQSLDLYCAADSAHIVGNHGRSADSFHFWGLPSCQSLVIWAGDRGFTGVVYAPNALLFFIAPGGFDEDFSGAFVGRWARFNTPVKIHYDENLARTGPVY
jgi:hypothetical protein